MPIHLPPISRRRFLTASASAAACAGMLPPGWLRAQSRPNVDPNRVALLSDTHVAADVARVARNTNMADNLRRVCAEVAALEVRPAHVLINGDFALDSGESADYAAALKLIEPVQVAGIPVHIGLGNHDHRERFWAAVPEEHRPDAAMKDKHVGMIETPLANWLILDSLDVTLQVRGLVGPGQLAWLAKTLDAHPHKPALVMVHHNPERGDEQKPGGLADTAALLDVLSSRNQAKALFYGHSHRWEHQERPDGLHLVNLPATAYVFEMAQPSGWVDAHVERDGAVLALRTVDPKHPLQGQERKLKWRA